jgi:WD40 repeat protein
MVLSAAFSPDGSRVVTASADQTARVWDAATGKPLSLPLAHQAPVASAAFSLDGSRVVTASVDRTARVWDAATSKPLAPPLAHQGAVWSAAFSPDGTRVVTASGDQTARVWDTVTGKPLAPPLAHQGRVMSAAFSPDGTHVCHHERRPDRVDLGPGSMKHHVPGGRRWPSAVRSCSATACTYDAHLSHAAPEPTDPTSSGAAHGLLLLS